MYTVEWGVFDYDAHNGVHGDVRKRKGKKEFDDSVPGNALSFFFRKEDSTSWDWVTLDLDKTKQL